MYGFYKKRSGKLALGVLAGLANRFNWDVWLVRLIFLVLTIFSQLGLLFVLAYIGAGYILPYKEDQDAERYGTGPRKRKDAQAIKKEWF